MCKVTVQARNRDICIDELSVKQSMIQVNRTIRGFNEIYCVDWIEVILTPVSASDIAFSAYYNRGAGNK